MRIADVTPANAPTDINPACPSDNSPRIPTTRFSDTAITIYAHIGTSIPRIDELNIFVLLMT